MQAPSRVPGHQPLAFERPFHASPCAIIVISCRVWPTALQSARAHENGTRHENKHIFVSLLSPGPGVASQQTRLLKPTTSKVRQRYTDASELPRVPDPRANISSPVTLPVHCCLSDPGVYLLRHVGSMDSVYARHSAMLSACSPRCKFPPALSWGH